MKKLLCVALTLMILVAAAFAAVPTSAAEKDAEVLTVTVNGKNPTKVPVGSEFIMRVGLNAGKVKILNGQVHMEYDSKLLSFDPYMVYSAVLEEDAVEGYCFPASIVNANIVMNYTSPGMINYNFSAANGVAVFSTTDKLFARFRFKALAAGTVDISHDIQYMINTEEHRIFYDSVPDAEIKPVTAETIEPALGLAGDADQDYSVTIMDATYMQHIAAGADLSYDAAVADVTGDKAVSLKDAVIVRKYLANKEVESNVGSWLFASELG